jgi:hypothetical protein
MFKKIAALALLILIVLFFVREKMAYETGVVVGDSRIEVRPGGWIWYAIKPSDRVSDDELVEIQLDIKHVSGGKAQVLIVDKDNFTKAENSPCWTMVVTATSSEVCMPDYEAISPQFSFIDFQGAETTDWINIGRPVVHYLLVTNINNHELLKIEVEARYRQKATGKVPP